MKRNRFAAVEWLFGEGLLSREEVSTFKSVRALPLDFEARVLARSQGAVPVDAAEDVKSSRAISVKAFKAPAPPTLMYEGAMPREFMLNRVAEYSVMLHEVQNGKMFLGYGRSTLILDEHRYLRDASSNASNWIAPALAHAPADLALNGTVAVLFADGASVFGHWMFDLLPKIEVLRQAGWADGDIDHYVVNSTRGEFVSESLSRLGIAKEKVVFGSGNLITGDQLLVSSRVRRGFCTPDWVREFIASMFLPDDGLRPAVNQQRKIYISRANARRRRVLNEEEICDFLESRGFRRVFAEHTSISEFAQLVYSSGTIVAPHGAGITNVAFAAPNVRVLELFGAHIVAEGWLMTKCVGGHHYLLAGRDHSGRLAYEQADRDLGSRNERNEADYFVDVGELGRALELMEG